MTSTFTADIQNRLTSVKRDAVINAHAHLRGFLAQRTFVDEDRVRAILVEYEKYVALQVVMSDDDL